MATPRPPAVTRVPLELWANILGFHAADGATKVEAVSSLAKSFYHLSLEVPEYWNKIPLIDGHTANARTWAQRARHWPITFIVHTPMEYIPPSVSNVLQDFAPCCGTIIMRASLLILGWLHTRAHTFVRLRSLLVAPPDRIPSDWEPSEELEDRFVSLRFNLAAFQALSVLDIAAIDFIQRPRHSLQGANLTTLRLREGLYGMNFEDFLRLLGENVRLQNLYLQASQNQGFTDLPFDIEYRLVLPELRNLELHSQGYHRWAVTFLHQLDASNLRELRLSGWKAGFWDVLNDDERVEPFPRLEGLCLNACDLSVEG